MKERPILFSTPMVKAILEGRKTMTRRIVKHAHVNRIDPDFAPDFDYIRFYDQHAKFCEVHNHTNEQYVKCPYGNIGDVLWVRETWRGIEQDWGSDRIEYKATETLNVSDKWRPSIFMPRAACRIRLKITDIKVESLQDISGYDALREGIHGRLPVARSMTQATIDYNHCKDSFVENFKLLWIDINGAASWDANPWVWVISFEKL